jgi:hypothetical protein
MKAMYQYLIVPPESKNVGVNALRIEPISPIQRCMLKPHNEQARWLVENRPHHVELSWSFFGYCTGHACASCPVAEKEDAPASWLDRGKSER